MFLLKHLLTHCLCGGHSRCAWGTSHCAAHLHPGPPAQATPAEQAAARGWRSQQENRGDDREHLRFWEPPHLPRDLWLFPVLCSCASTVPRTPLGLVRQQLCCRAWTRPSPLCYLEASNLTLALNSLLLLESMPAARKKKVEFMWRGKQKNSVYFCVLSCLSFAGHKSWLPSRQLTTE